ncbi:MAG TPA: hypothetical protein PLA92_02120 [Fimbriimonadaceae bacterium]|nr:hypothetical protein [Fimbriimonadaceae bacterium]
MPATKQADDSKGLPLIAGVLDKFEDLSGYRCRFLRISLLRATLSGGSIDKDSINDRLDSACSKLSQRYEGFRFVAQIVRELNNLRHTSKVLYQAHTRRIADPCNVKEAVLWRECVICRQVGDVFLSKPIDILNTCKRIGRNLFVIAHYDNPIGKE